jgi:hypothetical protein
MTELRFTGESLSYDISNATSDEIRSDRQITDLLQTGAEAGGGVNYELSYGTYDSLLESALFSTWTTAVSISGSGISANATENAVKAASGLNTNVHAGQWIKMAGWTATGNNTYGLVTSVKATSLVIAGGLTLTKEAAGNTITIASSGMLRNGTTEKSFTLERYHADRTQFFSWTGMVVNTWSQSHSASSKVTGSFAFIGEIGALAATTVGTGAAGAANTNPIINAASDIGTILEGSTLAALSAGVYIQKIDLTLSNNLRGLKALGYLGSVDVGTGLCKVNGTLDPYFYDNTYYDKYLAGTATGLSWRITDSSGNVYIYTIHNAKIETDKINSGGGNQDVMENIGWHAIRHSTYDCTIQIDRFAA